MKNSKLSPDYTLLLKVTFKKFYLLNQLSCLISMASFQSKTASLFIFDLPWLPSNSFWFWYGLLRIYWSIGRQRFGIFNGFFLLPKYLVLQSVSRIWASKIFRWWFGFRLEPIFNTAPAASKNTAWLKSG